MRIDILTIFPKMFEAVLGESILKRAQKKGLLKINVHNIRDYSLDKHRKVDDRPFGGGPGMVMQPGPIFRAVEHIRPKSKGRRPEIILLSPQGKQLNQALARELSKVKHLILICGHYEGIDERVKERLVDVEISIGDYVLTGGELPAMVLIDAIARLMPGVLGRGDSLTDETFQDNLLEYPQYTRPAIFKRMRVPAVLLSGDHKEIKDWRERQALKLTKLKRPEFFKRRKIK